MIYASLTNGMLLIGLSRRNLELLLQGNPIHKTAQGVLPELMVLFGETEDGIMKQLAAAGVDTALYDQQAANKEPV
jgi:hypothetical protein